MECEAREAAKVSASTASASRVARSRSPGFVRSSERARPRTVALSQQKAENEEMYHELHTKISSRSFNSRVAQALSTIKEVVESKLFLNVVEVAKGGSVGKGTAINECEDAELVFFVKGLPTEGHKKWLSPLLKSVQSVLTENLDAEIAASVECTETSVQVSMKNQVTVDLRFSPAFESYASTVQALGASGPEARKPFEASFVKERTQFVAKQPGNVKVTIRLLKWWRDQQQWSCALTRPSDYVIELIAIYARFDQLRVMWSNYYDQKDVWSPLMMQRPLLMDPVNPFSNIVDPQDFDSRELTQFASTTHFFW